MKYVASLALAAILSAAASANLVTNGGFEADSYTPGSYTLVNSVTGWSLVGSQTAGIGSGYLGSTSQEIDLSGVTDDTSGTGLAQTITTVAGQNYSLSTDVFTGQPYGASGGVDVYVGSTLIGSDLQGAAGRTPYSFQFTATGTSTTLTFLSNHGNVSHIDNVAVNAVPEPASMAALGLGALGLIRRRRNARKA